jgi:hypothetical protein
VRRRSRLVLVGVCMLSCALVSAQAPPRPAAADFSLPGGGQRLPPPLLTAIEGIQAPSLAAHIALLASDSLDGRGLGTKGLEATAEYIAATLKLAGIQPVTGTEQGPVLRPYFHDVPLRQITNPSGEVTVDVRHGESTESRAFLANVDALFPELPPSVLSAPVVFASYGIREASPARDDYRGLDVKDAIVLVLAGVPAGTGWDATAMRDRYAADSARRRFAAKAELARSLGARALLAIEGEGFPALLASGASAPAATFFAGLDDDDVPLPVVRITAAAGAALLAAGGLTPAGAVSAAPRVLPGATATIRMGGNERLLLSRNVIGVIPGADPAERDTAVVIGAHMDHLGRTGDRLFPGADDNASGTAALLEMAKAFATAPQKPRRTMVFAFWTGEEEGHLGSEHYVRHPLWPLERTAVYLNLDMIAHPWKPEEIHQLVADAKLPGGDALLGRVKPAEFIELGLPEATPDLGPVLVQASKALGLALHLDRTNGRSGGSDYRAFARKNIPFVRFFGNYFDGYHEPTDTAEAIDPQQVQRMARLAFASAWLFANR